MLMLDKDITQRWSVINDHVIGSEVGFGDMASVGSAKHQDLVIASGKIEMAPVNEFLGIHGISLWRNGRSAPFLGVTKVFGRPSPDYPKSTQAT